MFSKAPLLSPLSSPRREWLWARRICQCKFWKNAFFAMIATPLLPPPRHEWEFCVSGAWYYRNYTLNRSLRLGQDAQMDLHRCVLGYSHRVRQLNLAPCLVRLPSSRARAHVLWAIKLPSVRDATEINGPTALFDAHRETHLASYSRSHAPVLMNADVSKTTLGGGPNAVRFFFNVKNQKIQNKSYSYGQAILVSSEKLQNSLRSF